MTIEQADFNAFLDRARRGAFDASSAPCAPVRVLAVCETGGALRVPHAAKITGGAGATPEFDAQVDSGLARRGVEDARAHFSAAYQAALSDAPAIWLYEPRMYAGMHRRLTVGALRPDAWWSSVAEWSIDPAQRLPRDRRATATP